MTGFMHPTRDLRLDRQRRTARRSDPQLRRRPHAPDHLVALGIAGAVGFAGNEVAARVRLRAGRRLDSPALVADGYHARTDGIVSLGVVASAAFVALGAEVADPLLGL